MKIDVDGQFTPDHNVTQFATLPSHYATQKNPDEIVHRGLLSRIRCSTQPLAEAAKRCIIAKSFIDVRARTRATKPDVCLRAC